MTPGAATCIGAVTVKPKLDVGKAVLSAFGGSSEMPGEFSAADQCAAIAADFKGRYPSLASSLRTEIAAGRSGGP